ncbi:ectonucleotide pyrophosphatase/phosphodiesterase family member 5-like [Haliotis rufescens]|uniref:ectonucleotide pyrophosphatase/phosphodiesterase family member 5-like n=1 Tax=Haliotis rufescens TaxID=6454 RepID=UPI00201F481B|nr:ectonucleotide pyrophosphatase/phosphodiesterase family member 5-like [Haliotis rufescens]
MSSSIFLLLLAGLVVSVMADYTGKLLLVSMDGFRYDYLDMVDTPNFDDFARHGVKLPYMNNSFTTLTFPNHYTIVTGLWEESHGIIGNHMYDPEFNATFNMGTKETRWWDGGEPLWVTAKKQGLKTGTYYWPGSEVEIQGVRPNYWLNYSDHTPYKERVDTVIDWFKTKGVQMATLYYPEPDHTGHGYGPESQQVRDKVKYMDGILGYLVQKLKENDLENEVNVIITSDHGMVAIDNVNKVVDITDHVNMTQVERIPIYGPVMQIQPREGQVDDIMEDLNGVPNITAYKKENVPEHFHYSNNRRIMPIVIIADEGWQLTTDKAKQAKNTLKGTHGYDNRLMSMKPIFLARGPNFKTNFTSDPIQIVDIYPLVCKLLNIEPAPNNGSLDRVSVFIQDTPPTSGASTAASILLFECLLAFTIVANFML